jgi:hypothetical protein
LILQGDTQDCRPYHREINVPQSISEEKHVQRITIHTSGDIHTPNHSLYYRRHTQDHSPYYRRDTPDPSSYQRRYTSATVQIIGEIHRTTVHTTGDLDRATVQTIGGIHRTIAHTTGQICRITIRTIGEIHRTTVYISGGYIGPQSIPVSWHGRKCTVFDYCAYVLVTMLILCSVHTVYIVIS